jgi:hypothetical protein
MAAINDNGINIAYSECVPVSLVTQYAKSMCLIISSSVALGGLGRLMFRGLAMTLRHTTFGRTTLDE